MTLGERLQKLRKERAMTQEQLACEIQVSRQAISKWELDASLPETEKIVQLSKLFGVSTDYLLMGEVEESNLPEEKPRQKCQPGIVVSMCVAIGGLIVSIAGWNYWQTTLAAAAGVLIQVIAAAIFEIAILQRGADKKKQARRQYYALFLWLMLPFPVRFFTNGLLMLYPRPCSWWVSDAVAAAAYLIVCVILYFSIRRRK